MKELLSYGLTARRNPEHARIDPIWQTALKWPVFGSWKFGSAQLG